MPYVMNGIGTWYWGKRNIYKEAGSCEFCKAFCELSSYDTTLYFVIVFVPIFPLGKKRILKQCSRCEQHRVLKLKEWHQNKAKSIEEAFTQFRSSPTPENLTMTLSLLMSYQDKKSFEDLAQTVEKQMSQNVDLLDTLGAGYEKFGALDKAEAAYRQSLRITPSPSIQNILGRALLLQNRPDEAKTVLQRILIEKKLDQIGYLFLLVEGFQAQGRHQDALDVLNDCKRAFPEVSSDAGLKGEWTQYQKLAEKHSDRNKKIKAPHLIVANNRAYQRGEWKASIPGLISLGLFLLIIFAFLSSASNAGSNRKFFLVNGLHRPYQILINGQKLPLSATSYREIYLSEGTIQFQIEDPEIKTPLQSVQVETSFWSRPFNNYTFIINPDQTALLIREETTYSVNPNPNMVNPYKIYTGSDFYKFEGLDFEFAVFPETYSLSSKTATVKKTRIELLSKATPEENLPLLWDQTIKQEMRKDYFQKQLSFMPDQDTYLYALSAILSPEEMISFVKPKLDHRPIFVGWHRVYQNLILLNHPEIALIQEYQELLKKEPENGDLFYLLGAITPEFHTAKDLYQKAIQQKNPSAEAYYVLALQELGAANFSRALDLARTAKKLNVRPLDSDRLIREALMASNQFVELLLNLRQKQVKTPNNGEWIADEVLVLKHSGQGTQISKVVAQFTQYLSKLSGCTPEILENWKTYFKTLEIYADHNNTGYLEELKKMKDVPWALFQTALLEDRLEEAWEHLQTEQDNHYDDYLLLGAVCQIRQKSDLERKILQAVIEEFQKSGSFSEQILANAFLGKIKLAPEDVFALPLFPAQKIPVLLILSTMDPENKERYFSQAKQLNYSMRFPYWIYQEILESK
ncbi:MAG: hypothetical protein AABZ60_09110 [Planctomycetota bacterium]